MFDLVFTLFRSYTLAALRQQFALVSQSVFLFHGTVRENIAYGSPTVTDEQIFHAATQVKSDFF